MNAVEKVAWTELVVSLSALGVVAALFPWLGFRATTGFAILGLMVLGMVFLRKDARRVTIDERDRQIEQRAQHIALAITWAALLLALIGVTAWSGFQDQASVPVRLLNWLVWFQFATVFAIKGLTAILLYRRRRHAA